MSIENAVEPETNPTTAVADRGLLRRVAANPVAAICVLFLLSLIILGVLAPAIAPYPAAYTQLDRTNVGPFSTSYLLGGDQAGRDILSRLLLGTLGSLVSGVVLLAVSLLLGVSTGLIAGYYAGRVDAVLSWVANIVMALPGFVLLVALYSLFGPQIVLFMVVFGLLVAPGYFWLVRSLVQTVRSELYIDAAKVAGLSNRRIIARHVLRAVRGPVIVQSAFILAAGIGIQAALEFLGIGGTSSASWGGMLNDAFNNIYVAPVNIVWPAALISLVTLALVLIGNVVRDLAQVSGTRQGALSPREVRRIQAAAASTVSAGRIEQEGHDSEYLLQIRDLVVGYPTSPHAVHEVVRGVDLAVRRGEIHGLVGESGSGKSQIAFAVLGILPKEAVVVRGSIAFDGRDLLADPVAMQQVRGRRIAYIPQEPMTNLDPTFTVGQQLSFGLRAVAEVDRRTARRRIVDLLDRVGIKNPDAVFDLYPHQVSGGMAQRVLIAGALIGDPDLIIADEPTTALDVTVQASVLELLRGLQQERNLAVVLVTHNFGVVADICDRVSVMQQGRIVESRPVQALFDDPQHEYTQMLLNSSLAGAELRAPLPLTGGAA